LCLPEKEGHPQQAVEKVRTLCRHSHGNGNPIFPGSLDTRKRICQTFLIKDEFFNNMTGVAPVEMSDVDSTAMRCYLESRISEKGGADMACKSKGPCGTAKKPATKKTASKTKK
jgi:hypothetical protein